VTKVLTGYLKNKDNSVVAQACYAMSLYGGASGKVRKDFFEEIKRGPAPDVIFAHCRDELHQDHRVVGELTWNTFRDHVILEYEIPKYDGGLGSPTVFVPLTEAAVHRKIDLLMSAFETQQDKRWFTPETFLGLMRLRGIECNAPEGYAEAFTSRKLVLGTD
jgi:LmbE family N-acetylglucosaminyl deacetylase